MIFWIGLTVAFVAILLSLGVVRRRLTARYPRLSEVSLDILVATFGVLGLLGTALDRLQTETETPIVSAAAIVDLVIAWPTAVDKSGSWSAYLTGGVGYVAFARRGLPLIVIRSQEVIMKSISAQQASLVAICDLNAPGSIVHSSLRGLERADFLQLGFPNSVPEGARVDSGSVKITLNGSHEVAIPIARATVHDAKIIVELHGLRGKP